MLTVITSISFQDTVENVGNAFLGHSVGIKLLYYTYKMHIKYVTVP